MTQAKKDEGTGRFVEEPTPFDIPCGKTKECIVHAGTSRFRAVIDAYRENYAQALSKFEKMTVTLTIYELLTKSNSRFLKWNKTHKTWEELSMMAARDKVGHALRYANRNTCNHIKDIAAMRRPSYNKTEQPILPLPRIPTQAARRCSQVVSDDQAVPSSCGYKVVEPTMIPPIAVSPGQPAKTVVEMSPLMTMATTMKLISETTALLKLASRASSPTGVVPSRESDQASSWNFVAPGPDVELETIFS